MKTLIISLILSVTIASCFSQSNAGHASRIQLDIFVPKNIRLIQDDTRLLLEDRLLMLTTQNGYSGLSGSSFFIFPKISLIESIVTSSPPVQTIVELNISLYIADCIGNKIYSTYVFKKKGVGRTEQSAIYNAIKTISNNDKLSEFYKNAKSSIVDNYNLKCNTTIQKINSLVAAENYLGALNEINKIPEEAESCYMTTNKLIPDIYKKYINSRCSELMQKAKIAWSSKQLYTAIDYLYDISTFSSCNIEANKLISEIKIYVSENEKRRIEDEKMRYKDEMELNKYILGKAYDLAIESTKENQEYWKTKQQETVSFIIADF